MLKICIILSHYFYVLRVRGYNNIWNVSHTKHPKSINKTHISERHSPFIMISKTNVWNKTRSRQLHLNSNLNIMYSKEEGTRSFSYIKSITFICYSNVVLPTTCFILYQRNCQWMEKFQHISKQYIFPRQIYKKNIFLPLYNVKIKEHIMCLDFVYFSVNQY